MNELKKLKSELRQIINDEIRQTSEMATHTSYQPGLSLTYSNGVTEGIRIVLSAINDNLDLSIRNSDRVIEVAIDTLRYNEFLMKSSSNDDKIAYYRGVLSACRFAKGKLKEIKQNEKITNENPFSD